MNEQKLYIHVHNAITGTDSVREMTEEEQSQVSEIGTLPPLGEMVNPSE
jgi:hypothetical protein